LKELTREFREASKASDKRLSQLDDQLAKEAATLRNQLLEQSKQLTSEIEAKHRALSAALDAKHRRFAPTRQTARPSPTCSPNGDAYER